MPKQERENRIQQVRQLSLDDQNLSKIIRKDSLVSPENIPGLPFRVPSISPIESGQYELNNLALPLDWGEKKDKLASINWEWADKVFQLACEGHGLSSQKVTIDEQTGLLLRAEVVNEKTPYHFAAVALNPDSGRYESEDLKEISEAYVLQDVVARFLNKLSNKESDPQYSYIIEGRGRRNRFFLSDNLGVPRSWEKTTVPITTDQEQELFKEKAEEIANSFGHRTKYVEFDGKGLLRFFAVRDGNACYYQLVDGMGGSLYMAHNVDTLRQAAVLHGIGAAFINEMLEKYDDKIDWSSY